MIERIDPWEGRPSVAMLHFNQWQQLTAATQQYELTSDPEGVLRRGLVEESIEIVEEMKKGVVGREALQNEIGDSLWYVLEIARHKRLEPAAIVGMSGLLDDFQALTTGPVPTYADAGILEIIDENDAALEPHQAPEAALAFAVLRVADVMKPKNLGLWIGYEERPPLAKSLQELVRVAGFVASMHGIRLSSALAATMQKLRERERPAHAIEQAQAEGAAIASQRQNFRGVHALIDRALSDAYTGLRGVPVVHPMAGRASFDSTEPA